MGDFAFFSFAGLLEENLYCFRCRVVEQVVNVPEYAFPFSEVTFYSFLKVFLCRANVSVQPFFEKQVAYCTDVDVYVFVDFDDYDVNALKGRQLLSAYCSRWGDFMDKYGHLCSLVAGVA